MSNSERACVQERVSGSKRCSRGTLDLRRSAGLTRVFGFHTPEERAAGGRILIQVVSVEAWAPIHSFDMDID